MTSTSSTRLSSVSLLVLLCLLPFCSSQIVPDTLQDVLFFDDANCSQPADILVSVSGSINTWQYWNQLSSSSVSRTNASLANGSTTCVDQPFSLQPQNASGKYACLQSAQGQVGFFVNEYLTPGCNRTNSTLSPFINSSQPYQVFQFSGTSSGQVTSAQCVPGVVSTLIQGANGTFDLHFSSAYATFLCALPVTPGDNSAASGYGSGESWLVVTVAALYAALCMAWL